MILVIDDDCRIRMDCRCRLYAFGLNTCGASRRNAEKIFTQNSVNAIYLPHADTVPNVVGACSALRPAHPGIPIVAALPKQQTKVDLDRLYEVTDNILLLPLAPIRAAEVITELCRLQTGRDYAELRAGAVVLNLYVRKVFIYGQLTEVSGAELSLLRYLAEEAPRPITAEELCRCTGNPAGRRKTSCIRTHIAHLNRLSREVAYRPCIFLIKDEGYIIAPLPQNP